VLFTQNLKFGRAPDGAIVNTRVPVLNDITESNLVSNPARDSVLTFTASVDAVASVTVIVPDELFSTINLGIDDSSY
jgi:glutathionyl-hydroquinone reductase